MITYLTVKKDVEVVNKIYCDKCKVFISDGMEEQEMHYIDFYGGYSSVFGDMSHIKCDLCQHCLYEMIKDFCRYEDD